MAFETFIGSRYLRARQRQAFISLITFLSIAGVTVGVMALIVVIAVMSGFEAELKSRILGGQAHVMLMRHGGAFTQYRQVMEKVVGIDGVEAVTPYIYTQTMLRSANGTTGMIGLHPLNRTTIFPMDTPAMDPVAQRERVDQRQRPTPS